MDTNFYEISVKDDLGQPQNLSQYKTFVLLICNIATKCGLADKNFKRLAHLSTIYKDKGLKILLFPSNDFKQEPNTNKEIKSIIEKYSKDFILFDKIEVLSSNKHDIYKHLCGSYNNSWYGELIKWNFTKFVVDRNGVVRMRCGPTDNIEGKQLNLLEEIINEDSKNRDGL